MTDDLTHGGALDLVQTRFPNAPEPWIDLSTGINPWPYSYTDISSATLSALPTQTRYSACSDALADAINAPCEDVLLGPGSELLIRLLPTVLSPRSVAIQAPSYADHAQAWRVAGIEVIETSAPLHHAGTVDVLVICNPNNPDGLTHTPDELIDALEKQAQRGGWLIIDEAYCDLLPSLSLAPQGGRDGLIVLHSFGKFFGLPGLRLGAIIAPEPLRKKLHKRLGTWPVSGGALEIGARAYLDLEWQTETRLRLSRAREGLDQLLVNVAIKSISGTDLFRFIQTEDDAHTLWEHLALQGIYTRRFNWSRHHLRIGLPENDLALQRLAMALKTSV